MFPFLEHLSSATPNSAFYENLITLHKESKFSQLKNFSACTRDRYIDSNIKCALEFRSTLTTFTFNAELLTDENSPYYLFRTNLEDFPCLTELCIENNDTAIEALTINIFDSIIDECKYLKKFSFSTIYTGENTQPVDMQIVKPRPDIEKLNAKMTTLRNNGVLDYVQYKFPQLKELILDNRCDTVINLSYSSCWLENFPKLLTYISQIPFYHVQYRVDLFEKDILNIIQRFWDLPANRNTPKKIDVCHALPDDDGLSNTLIIKQTQSCLLHTTVSFSNSFSNRSSYSRGYTILEDLIERHGESIQDIALRVFCVIDDQIRYGESYIYSLEKLFFTRCFNIKSIRFEGLYVDCCSVNFEEEFSGLDPFSLNNLDFIKCQLGPVLLRALLPVVQYINRSKFDGCRQGADIPIF